MPSYPHVRRDEPPVDHRVRKAVGPVDQRQIEGPRLPAWQDILGGADTERHARLIDSSLLALRSHGGYLSGVRRHGLVLRAPCGEHDRARPRADLEGRPSW